jgi:hypothetical protein
LPCFTECRDADALPRFEAGAGFHPAAVDAYLALAEELLQVAEGKVREMLLEPAVKAHAGFVRFDGSSFDCGHGSACRRVGWRHSIA